ncbi:tetratricopeptide repeat protein [Leisingera sp. S232]|uniref:tetratricopeptide repeat protein n=1 Tax=Leisingera sp. S232 TaxID=3415132 RepID=UPI003C7D33FA
MIWRAFATAAVLLTAGAAQAQTIVTRSGEHKGFTRLVMRLPADADWSLTQSGTVATINIDAPEAVFDTSRVFNLIPRTRLQSLAQNGPGQPLRLQLACSCTVSSYLQKNGYLVVDIRDGGKHSAKPQFNAASSVLPLTPQMPQSGYRFGFSQTAATDARLALELAAANAVSGDNGKAAPSQETQVQAGAGSVSAVENELLSQINGLTLPLDGRHDIAVVQEAEPFDEAVLEERPVSIPETSLMIDLKDSERAAAVDLSEQRLLQQISRAANQGLVIVSEEHPSVEADTVGLDPFGAADRPLNPLDHISVTSAIDRETGLIAALAADRGEESHCLKSRDLAVHTWGEEGPFADQLAPLRSALVQEFDDVNPANVYALVRLYLYFSFGAEARSIKALLPPEQQSSSEAALLDTMAVLMDGIDLPVNHVLSSQQGCDSDSALWGVLADGEVKRSANTDAIQQAFSKLPAHLRVHLGPRVSKMFAEAGNHHVAEAILRAVDRTGVEDVPEINLAEAAIAELEGDSERMAEELTSEVVERTGNAPTALIELVALSVKERKAISPDVPDLIASYELESRETELGAELRFALVSAMALMGQFHESFTELESVTERDGPAARAAALEPLMLLLAERADDVTFLQHSLMFAELATPAEAAPVAEQVARRLLELGFAQQAQDLLTKLALEPENESRRLLMAEAALELEKPHRALVELMGLEGSAANKMRAQALWRNGEYSRAGEYLLGEDETGAAARGFWHSEDLEAIEAIDERAEIRFGSVASVTTQIGETAQDPVGLAPLAHARALVESSEGTRGGIADLLNQIEAGLDKPEEDQ